MITLFADTVLRYFSTFRGVHRKKIRTRASFNTTLLQSVSEESLTNNVYDKPHDAIQARFYFGNFSKRNESFSVEFIGFLLLQHQQNGCTVLFTSYQSTKGVCLSYHRWSHDFVTVTCDEDRDVSTAYCQSSSRDQVD